jgi:hypothetical protein
LIAQFVFIAANAFGVLLGVIYNANTPDLYPNNAHHKLGWIVTWVVLAQVVIGLLGRVAGVLKSGPGSEKLSREHQSFIPVSSAAMEEHDSQFGVPKFFRHSNDSGQGTEPGSDSLRNQSLASGASSPPIRDAAKEYVEDEEDIDLEDHDPLPASAGKFGASRALAAKIAGKVSSRAWKFLIFGYNFVDRTILILGFITLVTGIATFARFFVSFSRRTTLEPTMELTVYTGGARDFHWIGALDQGRRILLVGHPDVRPLGWLFRRNWMGTFLSRDLGLPDAME